MFHYKISFFNFDGDCLVQFLEDSSDSSLDVLLKLITLYIDQYGEHDDWFIKVESLHSSEWCQSPILKHCIVEVY